jgi:hypothetical protein
MQEALPQTEADWQQQRNLEVRQQMRHSVREAFYWRRRCYSLEAEVRILRAALTCRETYPHL